MTNAIIFGLILLLLIAGFGWLFYKLEIQKNKPKDKVDPPTDDTKE
ncbi:hypothetical protein [Flavobacterium sp. SM2513]